jgi:drug/metabolite transporter (DMT)-like permease
MRKTKHHIGNLSLIGVAAIWGMTFVIIKNALANISPFYFNAIRFSLASIFLLVFSLLTKKKYSPRLIKKGVLAGLALFGGYSFQTFGLNLTTAANAGFITGLSVVIVPLLMLLIYGEFPSVSTWFGITLAIMGLAIMTLESGFAFNNGDLIIFLCAICFALHIIIVGLCTKDFSTIPFVTVQITTVALSSWLVGTLTETFPQKIAPSMWNGLIFTALFATFLAYLIQNWAQKFTTPTHTALILAAEPVFTLIFATLLLKEVLLKQDLLGAILMLIGVLIVELKSTD